jgi:thiol:disulfide interchange protein DsbD
MAQPEFDQRQSLPEVKAEFFGNPLTVGTSKPTTFRIAVEVPPAHHGYLDQGDEGLLIPFAFMFTSLEERGAQVVMLSQPSGTRDEKARATVLRGRGEFTFSLNAPGIVFPSNTSLSAVLRYQICNDVTNICYPPREREVPLRFIALTAEQQSSSAPLQAPPLSSSSLSISERINTMFQRYMQHSFLAFVFVFAAGLLASATPCVYPVLPITSAILLARGGNSRQRAWLHALVYFLGIIFFYALLGLLAATTGTALSTIMTSAWVNLGFAVVFAYFGLSMLGLYEFQVFPLLTAKLDTASSRRGGFSGTLLMGITAGLVVSPCVGPVVGAILLEITGQIATTSVGSAPTTLGGILRGIGLMTGFGVGLGVPFLVIGMLSYWAPQSGPWLTRVKFILALPILYFAYTYYLKGMETARVPENATHAILVGIVAIGLAVFTGVFHSLAGTPQRGLLMRRALGVILLVTGVYFLYNGLGQSGILLTSSQSLEPALATKNVSSAPPLNTSASPQVEVHGNLYWLRDFSVAQTRAQLEHKPLFVDFYASWCANCKAFERLTLRDVHLNAALQHAVLVKLYDTDADFRTFQQDDRFPELGGVGSQPFLPLFAIYAPQGTLVWKGQNYEAVQTMIAQLEQAKRSGIQ